jgi:phasin family protein
MSNEMFSTGFDSFQVFLVPVVKVNKLAVANLEKLLAFQLSVLRSYTDFGLDRLKAAANIHDPESLQDFFSDQFKATAILHRQLLNDSKAMIQWGAEFQANWNKQIEETVKEVTDKTVRTAKEAADRAKNAIDKATQETNQASRKTA